MTSKKTVLLSGGFDPLHPGHVAMIEDAKDLGEVHVAVYSDDWLIRNKGFYFQPLEDRIKLLEVYLVHAQGIEYTDGTLCDVLRRMKPDYFAIGANESEAYAQEIALCRDLSIEVVLDLGGNKYSSSTAINRKKKVTTRWGWYEVLLDTPKLKFKQLHISAGKSISLQRHTKRSEFFFMSNGEVRINLPNTWHTLIAPVEDALDVFEVQVGISEEEDKEQILEDSKDFLDEVQDKIKLNR